LRKCPSIRIPALSVRCKCGPALPSETNGALSVPEKAGRQNAGQGGGPSGSVILPYSSSLQRGPRPSIHLHLPRCSTPPYSVPERHQHDPAPIQPPPRQGLLHLQYHKGRLHQGRSTASSVRRSGLLPLHRSRVQTVSRSGAGRASGTVQHSAAQCRTVSNLSIFRAF